MTSNMPSNNNHGQAPRLLDQVRAAIRTLLELLGHADIATLPAPASDYNFERLITALRSSKGNI